jgi:hypothetical protein
MTGTAFWWDVEDLGVAAQRKADGGVILVAHCNAFQWYGEASGRTFQVTRWNQ